MAAKVSRMESILACRAGETNLESIMTVTGGRMLRGPPPTWTGTCWLSVCWGVDDGLVGVEVTLCWKMRNGLEIVGRGMASLRDFAPRKDIYPCFYKSQIIN